MTRLRSKSHLCPPRLEPHTLTTFAARLKPCPTQRALQETLERGPENISALSDHAHHFDAGRQSFHKNLSSF
jgi:hypothetical protein